jgi:nucleoside-diphosphate-sugar epimerase
MKSRESTVLVTGGLGYIGAYVVRDLLERGWRVRVLDNRYRCDPDTAEEIAAGLDGRLPRSDLASVYRNLETLEEHDDVEAVYANFDIPESVLEAVTA